MFEIEGPFWGLEGSESWVSKAWGCGVEASTVKESTSKVQSLGFGGVEC